MSSELALRCAACEARLLGGDHFCEACGATIARMPATPVTARRVQLDLGAAAAVSEQGRSHLRNEDAFRVERAGLDGIVAVVCDGISTSALGDVAARAAATAAAGVLAGALESGDAMEAATVAAVGTAEEAVTQVPATEQTALAPPSCTLVSAACRDGLLVVGWVGDSRAYWLGGASAAQLTVDDSWATEQVAEGLLSPAEAFADQRAHAITRWIGADSPPDAPHVIALTPLASGRLVLCTDGLWNAAPAAADLARLTESLDPHAGPASVAHHLADVAIARGARDDVTVAVIDVNREVGRQP
jgi:serine/threonine protein phosphatase PrpC